MNLEKKYANLVRLGIDKNANLPDLNDMTDRGLRPLKPWTANKTVGTMDLIRRYNIQDEETFIEKFQAESKISLEKLTDQVYQFQKIYFGFLKHDIETIFKYTYCCVVLNSLQGNSTEKKFEYWAKSKMLLQHPPKLLDEMFHCDRFEIDKNRKILRLISIKPESFFANCLRYVDVFSGLQWLSNLIGKPWVIYYRKGEIFLKLELLSFTKVEQEKIQSWAANYKQSENPSLNTIISNLSV